MKATQRNFTSTAARAARECKLFFFCGQDEAGASSAAEKLVAQLSDPGERIELSGAEVKSDPVRLVDEARSNSLFGGTRHLWVRVAGEEAHDAVNAFVSMADVGETQGACPIIIIATSATDKSRTAKLLTGRKDALVTMFYPPDLSSVTAEVRAMAAAAGIKGLDGSLADRIARAAGLDVRLARSEIDKLALYLDASAQTPQMADANALNAIGATSEEDGLMPLVNVVLSGHTDTLPDEIRRMREVGLNPVSVLLALERRVTQLAQLSAKHRPGTDIKVLLEAERVFFRDRSDLSAQLAKWNGPRLERLVTHLVQLHQTLMANAPVAELLLAEGLVRIARVAGKTTPMAREYS